jgi:hypothetical protein
MCDLRHGFERFRNVFPTPSVYKGVIGCHLLVHTATIQEILKHALQIHMQHTVSTPFSYLVPYNKYSYLSFVGLHRVHHGGSEYTLAWECTQKAGLVRTGSPDFTFARHNRGSGRRPRAFLFGPAD